MSRVMAILAMLCAVSGCAGRYHWPIENNEDMRSKPHAFVVERWASATISDLHSPLGHTIAEDAMKALARDKNGSLENAGIVQVRLLDPYTAMVFVNWTTEKYTYYETALKRSLTVASWTSYMQIMEKGPQRWTLFRRYYWGRGAAN